MARQWCRGDKCVALECNASISVRSAHCIILQSSIGRGSRPIVTLIARSIVLANRQRL
nr:hypothetical protein 1 - Rhizobium leguminosarum bv. phaseoli [Rhizobium leguminosarum bv. phaseoli]AAA98208.1 ORF1 [Plasmid p42d]